MKFTARQSLQKGFTLVELLVVIGILGILAAALIAVLDPIEQLNKASDQSNKGLATEYVGAMQRYYATRQAYPMNTTANGGHGCGGSAGVTEVLPAQLISADTGSSGCVTALIATGELKTSFNSASNLDEVTVSKASGANPVLACFLPKSKAYQRDPQTKYTAISGGTPTCNSASATCYWCAQ